jgi:hypothetical protein
METLCGEARYFAATVVRGRLLVQVTEGSRPRISAFVYRPEIEVEEALSSGGGEQKIRTVRELEEVLAASTSRVLPVVSLWVAETLEEECLQRRQQVA